MVRAVWIAFACGGLLCCAADTPVTPGGDPGSSGAPVRVLVLTTTAGFRHGSIPVARQVLSSLAAQTGEFTVTATEDLSALGAANLASFDVLMFALTSGELPLDADTKAGILAFVANGGGFIGIHSATDTLYTWEDYGKLVGAYFKEHPWTQAAVVTVEDRAHPATRDLGASVPLVEEYYTFRENPRPNVHVLLSLDPASVGAAGDFPLAWTQTIGAGRSFYTALGHFESTWTDARFQAHLRGAIRWAAKQE
jgi:type 1 glutamine amidotransferase